MKFKAATYCHASLLIHVGIYISLMNYKLTDS